MYYCTYLTAPWKEGPVAAILLFLSSDWRDQETAVWGPTDSVHSLDQCPLHKQSGRQDITWIQGLDS